MKRMTNTERERERHIHQSKPQLPKSTPADDADHAVADASINTERERERETYTEVNRAGPPSIQGQIT